MPELGAYLQNLVRDGPARVLPAVQDIVVALHAAALESVNVNGCPGPVRGRQGPGAPRRRGYRDRARDGGAAGLGRRAARYRVDVTHRFVPAPVRQRHRRDHPVRRRERAGQHQLPRHQRRPAARRGSRDPVTPVLPRSAAHTPVLRVAFLALRRKITLQADCPSRRWRAAPAAATSPGRPAETARARYPGRTRRTGPRPPRPAPSAPRRRHPQWSAGDQYLDHPSVSALLMQRGQRLDRTPGRPGPGGSYYRLP